MLLRDTLSKNWVQNIEKVVAHYNKTPIKKLGYVMPDQIHSEWDSILVEDARKEKKIEVYKQPSLKAQIQNQKLFEKSSKNIQVGDYVYVDDAKNAFDKAYETQVNALVI